MFYYLPELELCQFWNEVALLDQLGTEHITILVDYLMQTKYDAATPIPSIELRKVNTSCSGASPSQTALYFVGSAGAIQGKEDPGTGTTPLPGGIRRGFRGVSGSLYLSGYSLSPV